MESGVDWRVVNGVWSGLEGCELESGVDWRIVTGVWSGLEDCEWSLEWIGGL